jgi:hypothetical protein
MTDKQNIERLESIESPIALSIELANCKPLPLKFGTYKLTVGWKHLPIVSHCNQRELVHLCEYFDEFDWMELLPVDQHNWLDNKLLEFAEECTDMLWELIDD